MDKCAVFHVHLKLKQYLVDTKKIIRAGATDAACSRTDIRIGYTLE